MKDFLTARIIKVNRDQYVVDLNGKSYTAVLSGKLRYQDIFPVIGDYVSVSMLSEKEVFIHEVKERSSYLFRPDGNGHSDGFVKNYSQQAMAANIDYLFIITSMNDDFSMNRLARFMATSIKGGCKPVVILTKADLCENKEEFIQKARQINSSVDIICVSSYTKEGLDELAKYLQPDITIGLLGSSGVGKSTLINTLAGSEIMKVSEIREKDSKGRHTTTHREMLNIRGTYFIDTPGMREFGLCDVEEGLNETFDDIAQFITQCKFSNCSHNGESGCAIQGAIDSGELSQERWDLYCSLMKESNRSKSMSVMKKVTAQRKKLVRRKEKENW